MQLQKLIHAVQHAYIYHIGPFKHKLNILSYFMLDALGEAGGNMEIMFVEQETASPRGL